MDVNVSDPFPLAVTAEHFTFAARLLGRPLAEVQDAAGRILVYRSSSGAEYFSIAQLARVLHVDPARIRAKTAAASARSGAATAKTRAKK